VIGEVRASLLVSLNSCFEGFSRLRLSEAINCRKVNLLPESPKVPEWESAHIARALDFVRCYGSARHRLTRKRSLLTKLRSMIALLFVLSACHLEEAPLQPARNQLRWKGPSCNSWRSDWTNITWLARPEFSGRLASQDWRPAEGLL
jgi:hypothetical protein